jgi:hypothetical protein
MALAGLQTSWERADSIMVAEESRSTEAESRRGFTCRRRARVVCEQKGCNLAMGDIGFYIDGGSNDAACRFGSSAPDALRGTRPRPVLWYPSALCHSTGHPQSHRCGLGFANHAASIRICQKMERPAKRSTGAVGVRPREHVISSPARDQLQPQIYAPNTYYHVTLPH